MPRLTHAISVSPLRQTVVADPGEEQIVQVTARNTSSQPITVSPTIDAFTIDENGRAVFGQKDEALSWIRATPRSVTIPPEKEVVVNFIVSIPTNAEPRGHYLGLFLEEAGESENQVNVRTRVGTLLFLHVGGVVTEALEAGQITTDKKIYTFFPAILSLELRNTGSIHVVPAGTVTVKNWRGEVLQKIPINETQRKVLPYTSWKDTIAVAGKGLQYIGPLTIENTIAYGTRQGRVQETIQIWYIPWFVILFVVSIVAGIAGLVIVLNKKKKPALPPRRGFLS